MAFPFNLAVVEGVRNVAKNKVDEATLRVRPPRAIGPDRIVRPYNATLAEAFSTLQRVLPDQVRPQLAKDRPLPREPGADNATSPGPISSRGERSTPTRASWTSCSGRKGTGV